MCRSGLDERNVLIVTFSKRNEEKEDRQGISNMVENRYWRYLMFGFSSHGYPVKYSELPSEKNPQSIGDCRHVTWQREHMTSAAGGLHSVSNFTLW